MDGVQGLSKIAGTPQVNDRGARNKQQQAEQFDRAMHEQGESPDGTAAEREPEQPVRRALQRRPGISRNDHGEAMHVDVIA